MCDGTANLIEVEKRRIAILGGCIIIVWEEKEGAGSCIRRSPAVGICVEDYWPNLWFIMVDKKYGGGFVCNSIGRIVPVVEKHF